MELLLIVSAVVAFAVFMEGVSSLLRWWLRGDPPALLRPLVVRADARRRRACPPPVPDVLLGLELARLAVEVQRLEAADVPCKAERLDACRGAYDLVLMDLCERAGIPRPAGRPPLSPHRRLRVEAELIAAGYEW